jgi:hypothetical protein
LKLRANVREKRGDWEELVDNATGRTFYYRERTDTIQFKKPKRWVRLLVEHFERGGLGR